MTKRIGEISLRIRVDFRFFLAIIVHLNFIKAHESSHVLKSKKQFRKYINNSTKQISGSLNHRLMSRCGGI